MDRYGYIYCTTDLKNGMKYIGKKVSNKFILSYFGSGTLIIKIKKKRPETRRKMSEKAKLRCEKIEHRIFLGEINKGNTYTKGKIFTEEHKEKLSTAKKGIKQTQETINKRVKSKKGYRHSIETINKIRLGNLNKKHRRKSVA